MRLPSMPRTSTSIRLGRPGSPGCSPYAIREQSATTNGSACCSPGFVADRRSPRDLPDRRREDLAVSALVAELSEEKRTAGGRVLPVDGTPHRRQRSTSAAGAGSDDLGQDADGRLLHGMSADVEPDRRALPVELLRRDSRVHESSPAVLA